MRGVERQNLLPGAAAFSAALLVALLGLTAGARESGPQGSGTVELQLLGVNDFHGHLEPPEPGVGGAAWLGAWLDRAGLSHPDRTIRVHAGDMVGVSPLISSHFNDEPTIEATNLMGFDVGTLGNHEFDEGGAEALRLVRRARYPYIAANTVTREGGELILPPYRIVERSGVKVGFIGVTTEDTPYFLLSAVRAGVPLARPLGVGQPLGGRAAGRRGRGDRGARPRRRLARRAWRRGRDRR